MKRLVLTDKGRAFLMNDGICTERCFDEEADMVEGHCFESCMESLGTPDFAERYEEAADGD